MKKDFNKWNKEKQKVDNKAINKKLYFHKREIWWCSTGLNIGVETDGKNDNFERPVIIIKKFNSEMIWILPLTTKENNKYTYKLETESVKSFVMLSQIKTISTKRLLRKIGQINNKDYQNILNLLIDYIKIESPLAGAFSEAEATNKNIIHQSK